MVCAGSSATAQPLVIRLPAQRYKGQDLIAACGRNSGRVMIIDVKDHITICICTYKRTGMLGQLLGLLANQDTLGLFTYSILVIDNDSEMSGATAVGHFQKQGGVQVDYRMEAAKGIPMARNRAITESDGNLLAFIDDDELPNGDWLLTLFKAMRKYNVAGVLGPVRARFVAPPPRWILKCKLFERPSFRTGTVLNWPDTRTGNVLLQQYVFKEKDDLFNPKIGHGEDKDFFRRMMGKGHAFVWCDEAAVYEIEPPERLKRSYFLKRALIRGSYYVARATCRPGQILKSLFALAAYIAALPVLSLFGQHLLMKSLIGICDHAGCLIGACGLKPEKYFKHT